ncbi:hypothetical protein Nepgr_001696 [Nepenthes gracilis]|uniref:Uncharacterized protein n=1 Tax=Nepenthes gracilis TaxID=150966 RepID=A0AAD3P8W1_NEPGR|nr:hypothetical protein Nepgr_001696 [Nepenthes gracilis]
MRSTRIKDYTARCPNAKLSFHLGSGGITVLAHGVSFDHLVSGTMEYHGARQPSLPAGPADTHARWRDSQALTIDL